MDLERVITDVLKDGDVESIAFTRSEDRVWARVKLEDDSITTGLPGLEFMLSPYLPDEDESTGDVAPSESEAAPTLTVPVESGPPTTMAEIQNMMDERKAWVRKNPLKAVTAELLRRNGGDGSVPLSKENRNAMLRLARVAGKGHVKEVVLYLQKEGIAEHDREKGILRFQEDADVVQHFQSLIQKEITKNANAGNREQDAIDRFDSLHLELSARLDTLMRREGLSVDEVAEESGLSASTIQRFRASVDPGGQTHYLLPSTFRTIYEYITTKTNER